MTVFQRCHFYSLVKFKNFLCFHVFAEVIKIEKKYQSLKQGHLSDHLPRLVDPPMHKIFDADKPLRSLLLHDASRPAKAMIEVLIPSSPVSFKLKLGYLIGKIAIKFPEYFQRLPQVQKTNIQPIDKKLEKSEFPFSFFFKKTLSVEIIKVIRSHSLT